MAGKDPFKISAVMSNSYAHLGIEAKLREHHVKKAWTDAVGSAIAGKTAPSKLIGTTLYCIVSSAPWMAELTYQKPAIIAKLNELLGVEAVSEIVFKPGKVNEQAPKTTKAKRRELTEKDRDFIEQTVKPVKDEALRERIKRAMEKAKG